MAPRLVPRAAATAARAAVRRSALVEGPWRLPAAAAAAARAGAAPARRSPLAAGRGFSAEGGERGIAFPDLGNMSKDRQGAETLYDKWAADYDECLRSWDYPAPRRVAELLKSYADASDLGALRDSSLPILDAGCGTGLSGEALKDAGFKKLVGTDVSVASLDFCREKGIYTDLQACDLECANGPAPFADDSLAGVTCVGVLSYVHQFDKAFGDWCRMIAPGGLAVFTHRDKWWDDNIDGVQDAAKACNWIQRHISEPQDYMPNNPDPAERAKRIRYFVYEVRA